MSARQHIYIQWPIRKTATRAPRRQGRRPTERTTNANGAARRKGFRRERRMLGEIPATKVPNRTEWRMPFVLCNRPEWLPAFATFVTFGNYSGNCRPGSLALCSFGLRTGRRRRASVTDVPTRRRRRRRRRGNNCS